MKKCSSCGREFQEQTTFCPFDGKKLDAPEPADVDKFLGTVLDGKYCVESKIGQGGMGNVYKAKHVHMDTMVAVKILHPHLVSDQTTVERFRREARAAITVNHPNAIHVMDFGVTGDKTVYLVMEFLEGISLRKLLEIERCLTPEKALNIMKQVCAAVDTAHSKGIIHRDLKPDNIVIVAHGTPSELVKVLDFSIAKLKAASEGPVNLTQQGMVVGTPQYMSPEQAEGQELDTRSDLYSLGVIMYEMLTGDLPFKATTPMALILKHIHALPRPLRELKENISPALEAVVLRTLAKKREDRPQSATILAEQLEEAMSQENVSIRPETSPVIVRPTGEAMMGGAKGIKPAQPIGAYPAGATAPLSLPNEVKMQSSSSMDYSGDLSLDPRDASRAANKVSSGGLAGRPQTNPINGSRPNAVKSIPPQVISTPIAGSEENTTSKPNNTSRLLVIMAGAFFAIILGLIIYFFFFNEPAKVGNTTGNDNKDFKPWLDKMQMVSVPTGTYMMGREVEKGVPIDSTPAHLVKVPAFLIGRYEVTNKQYQEYLKATNRSGPEGWTGSEFVAGQEEFAVSGISWDEANAYCQWLSTQSGLKFRLLTEAEWEYAARGTDNRLYPWGTDWDSTKTVSGESNNASIVAVTSALLTNDRSPYGIIGMCGNVFEWTASPVTLYPNSAAKIEPCNECRIIRGGSYKSKKEVLQNTNRFWQPNDFRDNRVGFRLGADLP
ncbi:MAG: SUMF1/EgtB/PvdO family nonheme iron enzyme [Blastocatellia bacterium]|nr:SUMF1/EgtB/PvdO family nonheme iron enzyme [Blastocatellia bacterium]MBL8196846.1 SUMF1/EgtB/PvdO family nonheme iron enzyme [Blastocatellia bacterium]MBN8724044.1 SUMF1/EgtB/PvdO family nonheme iron enzyme [Acidobacteriota bacterium]